MASAVINNTNAITGISADGDTLIFQAGTTNVDTGLDLSAYSLAAIHVLRAFSANIGSSGTSLKTDVDNAATSTFTYNAGGGAVWYTPNGSATGGTNICQVLRCIGFGTMTVNGTGTVTRLESGQGQTIIGGNIAATNVHVAGGNVTIQGTSGTAPTTIEVTGGVLKTARGCTTISIYGGNVEFDATQAITTLNVTGGRLKIIRSGTITTLNLLAGNALNIDVSAAITITNTVIWGSVQNASAILDNPMLTFTNAPTWRIATGNNF